MKKRTKSSKRWLREHFRDPFVKQAQAEGQRSRAVYKLQEIDKKDRLFKPGMVVIDLGAAPGAWSAYVAERLAHQGQIVALDLLEIAPLPHVTAIQGDFLSDEVLSELVQVVGDNEVDVILSDMAPNVTGNVEVDQPRSMYLSECVMAFTQETLKLGGSLVIKVFHGEGFDAYLKVMRRLFKRVQVRKPEASRARSRECYLVGKEYVGDSINV